MNKNEYEFQIRKLAISSKNQEQVMSLAAHAITMGTVAGSIYMMMSGLQTIVLAQPEAITALADVVDKLRINAIVGYIVSCVFGAGWFYERKGKKRAISQNGELRREIESNDAYHASSGLDTNGNTPK